MIDTTQQLQDMVRRIASEDADDWTRCDEHEKSRCDDCIDAYGAYWIDDRVYDAEYLISMNGTYLGAIVKVAGGGPNIYIDTRDNEVKGYWGSNYAKWCLNPSLRELLDEEMESYYESVR